MKISQNTLRILKSFAAINNSIVFHPGSFIEVADKNESGPVVLAQAKVEEVFPEKFAIYDLISFINCVSLMEEPEFEFTERYILIQSDKSQIKYVCCDPRMVHPDKLKFPSKKIKPVLKFDLSEQNLTRLLKTSSVISLPDIILCVEGSEVILRLADIKDSSYHSYELKIDENVELNLPDDISEMKITIKRENLKVINKNYLVEVYYSKKSSGASVALTSFKSQDGVEYYIAVDGVKVK